MSIWTHVAAIIRIDSIRDLNLGPQSKEELERILGPVAMRKNSVEDWNSCTLPCGSEGSLQYTIWENENEHCLAAFTVSIFGDLRDYEETEPIEKWFNEFCGKFPLIRQAICVVEVEYSETKVFQYKEKNK